MGIATNVLKDEHRGIEKMLRAIEKEIPALRAGNAASVPLFEQAVDFFRGFADGCHHVKEEQVLFPAMARKGFSTETGPVAVMLAEHEQGRGYIRAMADALARQKTGDPKALGDLAYAAERYAELLSGHIQKEDNVLFVMADRALNDAEQTKAAEAFERTEEEVVGPGVHERYHKLLDTL